MAQVDVLNMAGEVVGQIQLNDYVFGIEPNASVVHQAVVAQLANARRGTADTKTRSEIRASGSKLWRQKGTGRARQGSRRAPHWKGGGVAFGPHPRSYAQRLPRKMRRLALRSALSSMVADEKLLVLEQLELTSPKTKEMAVVLKTLGIDGKAMIVLPEMDEIVGKATRNLPEVMTVVPSTMNLLDLMSRDKVVMTVDAVNAVTQWLGEE
ncbi:MAG: 50S ribosomal protein L4 [Chloroflexota bacterium]|jgi:large subunit ribosomal protein L4